MYENVVRFALIQLFRTKILINKNKSPSISSVNNLDVHKIVTESRMVVLIEPKIKGQSCDEFS